MSKLGLVIDTSRYVGGTEYGIYNKNFDYYISVVQAAATPEFNYNASNSVASGGLQQSYLPINYYTIYPDIDQETVDITEDDFFDETFGEQNNTMIGIPVNIDTPFILTVNGLVLAKDVDYTYSGDSIVYFNAPLVPEDIVTIIYTSSSPNTLQNDIFEVLSIIPSGATDGQGSYSVYYNTTTNKYELFTSAKPIDFSKVLVMINGAVLANGVDFYQSTSNPRRIILNGDLIMNDIITISYFPDGVVGNIITESPIASWYISPPPTKVNGYFTFELASDFNFTNIVYSSTTDYFVGAPYYSINFPLSGYTYGDKLFYRVKNDKNYETICGNIINSFAYSEIIPITIATNTINSY
jgi:predicted RNA-binding protein